MAEFLFVTWDGGGNVPPALGIASELRTRGHGVRFLGHEGNRTEVTALGFAFSVYERAIPFTRLVVNPPERMVEIFNDPGIAEDLVDHARREPTDVVVVDCLMLAAMAAARGAGLTYVPLEHFFDAYYRNGWLRAPFGQAAEARGHAPYETLDAAPLVLAATLAELDPAGQDPRASNLLFSGPIVAAPPTRDLSVLEPTILASLSTYGFPGQTELMQNILDAVDGLPARVVVTTGPVIDPKDLRAPANAEVHAYVDHDLLMPETTLLVGHGGHATTMRALAHDLPMVVLPVHPMLDQRMVGQAVEDAGAGQLLAAEARPEEIRRVVERLLAAGPHRAAAARLGALVREANGAASAGDALLALVSAGAALP